MTKKDINIDITFDVSWIIQKNKSDQLSNRTKNTELRYIKRDTRKIAKRDTSGTEVKDEESEEETLYSKGSNLKSGFLIDEPPAYEDIGIRVGTCWIYSQWDYTPVPVLGYCGNLTICFNSAINGFGSGPQYDFIEDYEQTIISGNGATAFQVDKPSNNQTPMAGSTQLVQSGDTHFWWDIVGNPPVRIKRGANVYSEAHLRTNTAIPLEQQQYLNFALPVGKGVFLFVSAQKCAWYSQYETGYYRTTKCWDYPGKDQGGAGGSYTCYSSVAFAANTPACAPDYLPSVKQTMFYQSLNADNYTIDILPWFPISNSGFVNGGYETSADRTVNVYVGTSKKLRKIYSSYASLPEPMKQVIDGCFPAPYLKTINQQNQYRGSSVMMSGSVYDYNFRSTSWSFNQDDGWYFGSNYHGIVFTPQIYKYINENFHNFTASTKSWDQVKSSTRKGMWNESPSSAYRTEYIDDIATSLDFYSSELRFKHDQWRNVNQDPNEVATSAQIYEAYGTGDWFKKPLTDPPELIPKPINKAKSNYSMVDVEDRYVITPGGVGQQPYLDFYTVWDWDDPSYCRQKCLELGFEEEDLVP